ncbi:MAG: hypothetical protein LBL66_08655 [Clostridiales bacterium]|nr:hypothetical protein [Clostridiales bacterium]
MRSGFRHAGGSAGKIRRNDRMQNAEFRIEDIAQPPRRLSAAPLRGRGIFKRIEDITGQCTMHNAQ